MHTSLADKRLLIIGVSGSIGSQTCFKWALEGCHIIGIGSDADRLEMIQREIDDVSGEFNAFTVDLADQNVIKAVIKTIFDQWSGVDFIINLVGEYGPTWISNLRLQPYNTAMNCHSNEAINFYHCWMDEYATRSTNHHSPLALKQVIDVVGFNRGLGSRLQEDQEPITAATSDHPVSPSMPIRYSCVYVDDAGAIASSPSSPPPSPVFSEATWAAEMSTHISPALIVSETLNLLTNTDYGEITDVLIRPSGENVVSLLYSVSPDGSSPTILLSYKLLIGNVLHVYIKETEVGRGLFASKDFVRGELILQTTGKVMHHQTEHSLQIGWNQHFEPDAPIRFINHSCEPNVGVKTNQLGVPDFYAFKTIRKDEELTFDYAMTEFTHFPRENPEMEFDLTCYCGAPRCRGKLGYYSELPESVKQAYEGFVSDYFLSSAPGN